jgi:hypothetical protein
MLFCRIFEGTEPMNATTLLALADMARQWHELRGAILAQRLMLSRLVYDRVMAEDHPRSAASELFADLDDSLANLDRMSTAPGGIPLGSDQRMIDEALADLNTTLQELLKALPDGDH